MIWRLHQISDKEKDLVGGKAFALARMIQHDMTVPAAICIGADAYREFSSTAGLREQLFMELNRKRFDQMRWEEMWDASLRIRNMFLRTPIPTRMCNDMKQMLESEFGDRPVAVRSSAPGEDSATTSFAGLHESYVNIRGADSIVEHVRLVWASLWSDRALLYRQELGLDVEGSAMAVVVQELVAGERSGVVFGISPQDESQGMVEAVHGLNQGLVDGTVEPDRWIVERKTGMIISHSPAKREKAMVPSAEGVQLQPLSIETTLIPPLDNTDVKKVFALSRKAEALFNSPQDVEWTFGGTLLYALQSRPITTVTGDKTGDERSWYLSLTRSFENLSELRERIEGQLIPAMMEEADRLVQQDPSSLSDTELAAEISRRMRIYDKWTKIYWDEFIPFAHGARLFGQVYGDTMHPSDPFEFIKLLGGTGMASLERNAMLGDMADMIRTDPTLAERLRSGAGIDPKSTFSRTLDSFVSEFGEFTYAGTLARNARDSIIRLLLEMASRDPAKKRFSPHQGERLTRDFLSRFEGEKKVFAENLLDLARASYRLRDDDNIYLGRIDSQVHAAVEEGRQRISRRGCVPADGLEAQDIIKILRNPDLQIAERRGPKKDRKDPGLQARQIVGQPAGPGIGTGKARVIESATDLFEFKAGEILVCDAIDPNMTFVVPLAAGIVERRGGMLIHGAIIAREYGLPCVTGVPNATSVICTGQQVTVDGFLGIVVIGQPTLRDDS
jgi:pyruvate,water dikinase